MAPNAIYCWNTKHVYITYYNKSRCFNYQNNETIMVTTELRVTFGTAKWLISLCQIHTVWHSFAVASRGFSLIRSKLLVTSDTVR